MYLLKLEPVEAYSLNRMAQAVFDCIETKRVDPLTWFRYDWIKPRAVQFWCRQTHSAPLRAGSDRFWV